MLPFLFFVILSISSVNAQSVKWQRTETARPALELFHSSHAINLPTGETLQKGDFEFEISHRFVPPMSEGYDAFWGLDGPAHIRFGMAYSFAEDFLVTLGRTNLNDNTDLQIRYKFWTSDGDMMPVLIALNLGAAWNTEVAGKNRGDNRNFQYFGQLIANTMIAGKLGIGVAPSYLYNSSLYTSDVKKSLALGTYVQYYLHKNYSVLAEWTPTWIGWRDSYNSFSIGIEIETGGHFFKMFAGNNAAINLSQYLAGADLILAGNNLRFGFLITRLL